jgi:S1-C subfamily serine protease
MMWISIRLRLLQGLLVALISFGVSSLHSTRASEASVTEEQTPVGQAGVSRALMATLVDVQSRCVKIYGAGMGENLENYQSGFFVSAEGHVLTSWSTVLDVDKVLVVTSDGKRWDASLVGVDPLSELAVLKIDADGFSFFSTQETKLPEPGDRVFAVSNLFGIATGDEASSLQRGIVMAVGPLQAGRGSVKIIFRGDVIFIDVMTNNPGAKGGALVDGRGNLVGLLGKELRDENTGIWINYAMPTPTLAASIKLVLEGKTAAREDAVMVQNPHRLDSIGLVMIPDLLARTPAFVDRVVSDSLAAKAGLQANDLVLLINSERVGSRKDLEDMLSRIDQADAFAIVVQRGQELVTLEIRP